MLQKGSGQHNYSTKIFHLLFIPDKLLSTNLELSELSNDIEFLL